MLFALGWCRQILCGCSLHLNSLLCALLRLVPSSVPYLQNPVNLDCVALLWTLLMETCVYICMFQSSLKKLQLQHLVVTTKIAAAVFDRSNPESTTLPGVFDICICICLHDNKKCTCSFCRDDKNCNCIFCCCESSCGRGNIPTRCKLIWKRQWKPNKEQ